MRPRGNALLFGGERFVGAVLLALLSFSCVPPPALPVRGVLAGAPGRLAPGQLELTAAGLGFFNQDSVPNPPTVPGGWAGYALDEHFSFEVGGVSIPIGQGAGFGFFGARWTRTLLAGPSGRLVVDADLGLGLGGTLCTDETCPNSKSPRTFELGATQGGAIGYTLEPITLYLRLKLEEGSALRGPVVLWPFAVLGVEARLAKVLSVGVSAGEMGAYFGSQSGWVPFYQLQATLFLDAPWRAAQATSASAR